MPRLLTFGTLTFSSTSMYDARVEAGAAAPFAAQVDLRPRRSRHPARDGFRLSERTLSVTILNRSQTDIARFWRDVFRTFAPVPSTATLTATHDQTGGTVMLDVDVTNVQQDTGGRDLSMIHVDCLAADPIWRDTADGTVVATGGTVVNSGDFPALPRVVVTPNLTGVKRRRITVSDNTGRGLGNYFVRAKVDTSGLGLTAASQLVMFYKGRAIPFYAGAATGTGGTVGGTATNVDFRVDLPPSSSNYVDLYYGTAIANTDTANRLDYGQLYGASNDLGNGTIVWSDLSITTAPAGAAFSWTPAKVGQSVSGATTGLTAEGTALYAVGLEGVRFQVAADDSLPDDVDGMVTVVGTDGAFNGLTTLERRFYTNGGCRAFVRGRDAGGLVWRDIWTSTTAGTYTGDLQVSFCVQLAVGVEPIAGTAAGTLDVFNGNIAGTYLVIRAGQEPSVSVGSAGTAFLLNGTLANGTNGQSVRFGTVLMDNDTLSIDAYAQTITTAGTTPWYGDVQFSDPDQWFSWPVGSNALSGVIGGTVSYEYRRRWII